MMSLSSWDKKLIVHLVCVCVCVVCCLLLQGLYPESHGMVGNVFYDSEFNDTFNFTSRTDNLQSKWWGGEPVRMASISGGVVENR